MAAEEPPSNSEHSDTDTASEHAESQNEEPVESLVRGRAKRANAGAQMSTLLESEQNDDPMSQVFAAYEDEEDDNEFDADAAEEDSDVQLDSGSSDDEQGPAKDDDDLEGEKELQRQLKADGQKKRKAQDSILKPGAIRKKVKVGASATAPTTPAPRPKKKSERVSWLHPPEDGPVRSSSRKATVQNKEYTHARLVASEKQRAHQNQVMAEAHRRKEASRPKALTQAQRMEEALRTERANAKSLNRWEASEKKRTEEQKAKLEALHNRQLTGPVVSWWSGMANWVDGKLKQVGWKSIQHMNEKDVPPEAPKHDVPKAPSTDHRAMVTNPASRAQSQHPSSQPASLVQEEEDPTMKSGVDLSSQEPEGFLQGIYDYANRPEEPGTTEEQVSPKPEVAPSVGDQSVPAPYGPVMKPSPSPAVEHSTRNLVILKDIDANAQRLSEVQNHVLLKRRNGKAQSKSYVDGGFYSPADSKAEASRELCAITEQPARYKDPKTGLPYADSYAYKEIQKLANGASRWSSLLGCYVGPTSSVARGVPDRFWRPP
ncbi:MAG: hypothetical protein Q9174_000055 [Haloplaca sp. 1 TL-2023]